MVTKEPVGLTLENANKACTYLFDQYVRTLEHASLAPKENPIKPVKYDLRPSSKRGGDYAIEMPLDLMEHFGATETCSIIIKKGKLTFKVPIQEVYVPPSG